jgi:hypothetical protein
VRAWVQACTGLVVARAWVQVRLKCGPSVGANAAQVWPERECECGSSGLRLGLRLGLGLRVGAWLGGG